MEPTTGETLALWPLAVYLGAVIIIVAGMLGTFILGQRHKGRETDEPYESGIRSTGSARLRLSPQFYLVAMFFVIFDLEAVFIVAWAISFREAGWAGYLELLIFIGILMAALGYIWRLGALDLGSTQPARWRSERENVETHK